MMNITERSLLGRGLSFPYNRSERGGLAYTDGVDRINQSLFLLFSTPKGSRLMMPEWGSDLDKLKYEPLDSILMERARYIITEDVKRWEPRISLVSVEFLEDSEAIDNSILYISLNYRIINTSITGNFVYPYSLSTYDTIDANYN